LIYSEAIKQLSVFTDPEVSLSSESSSLRSWEGPADFRMVLPKLHINITTVIFTDIPTISYLEAFLRGAHWQPNPINQVQPLLASVVT
jgi:hypothetical protein